jgi:hypothetical protein
MTSSIQARVTWVPAALGGRSTPPGAGRYVTVSRFNDPRADWSDAAWSVVLELHGPADGGGTSRADVKFLVPEAPHDLLRPGTRFDLYEGARRVAQVDVVAVTEPSAPVVRSNVTRSEGVR